MNRTMILFLASALCVGTAAVTGCGDDDSGGGGKKATGGTGGTGGTGATGGSGGTAGSGGGTAGSGGNTGGSGGVAGSDGGTVPTPPTLGAQIDRMGRPAINTALNKTFEADNTKKQAAKDAYNLDGDTSKWGGNVTEFQGNLAILDSLDTVCGNQLLYNVEAAQPYSGLAGALAKDWLIVDVTKTTCGYLGYETPVLGLGTTGNCGGRMLADDVIDLSYSGLAAGAAGFPSGKPAVGDGVAANDKAFLTSFPYLAAPN